MPTVETHRRLIATKLGWDPELSSYKEETIRVLSEQYQAIRAAHPWTFAMATVPVAVRSDLNFGAVAISTGSRTLTGTATFWSSECEQAEILLNDNKWYRIGRFSSSTLMYLDEPYTGPGHTTADDHVLRFRSVPMPKDTVGYHNVEARIDDRGQLRYVSRNMEERAFMDGDDQGDPTHFTDADAWTPRTPDKPLTATASASGGTLATGTYRYRYTYQVHGVESAPSEYVEVSVTGPTGSVGLVGFLDTDTTDGRRYALYRCDTAVGIYYRVATGTASSAATVTDTGGSPDREAILSNSGQSSYIRFWPLPVVSSAPTLGKGGVSFEQVQVDVRYHSRGRSLYKDSDYPELPEEYHDILTNRALAEMFIKHGSPDMAAFYRKIASDRTDSMMRRYLDNPAHRTIRRARGDVGWDWFNYGTPSRS